MKTISLLVASALLLLSLTTAASPKTVVLNVDKMDCPSCPFMIKKALEDLPGVSSATVSMETKRATIDYESDDVSVAEFISTTSELGFPSNELKQ